MLIVRNAIGSFAERPRNDCQGDSKRIGSFSKAALNGLVPLVPEDTVYEVSRSGHHLSCVCNLYYMLAAL